MFKQRENTSKADLDQMVKFIDAHEQFSTSLIEILSRRVYQPWLDVWEKGDRIIAVNDLKVINGYLIAGTAMIAKNYANNRHTKKFYQFVFTVPVKTVVGDFIKNDEEAVVEGKEVDELKRIKLAIRLVNLRVNWITKYLEENDQLLDELAEVNNEIRNR